jgi:hypothetical protein
MKSGFIVYGFRDFDQLNTLLEAKQPIILIEPRKSVLDTIKTILATYKTVTLIPKALHPGNVMTEIVLYKSDQKLFTTKPDASLHTTNERVFTTSFCNIIKENNIQVLHDIIININVENINDIFNNLEKYHHIVSRLKVSESQNDSFFRPKADFITTNFNIDGDTQGYTCFCHKNLHVPLPRICMYLTQPVPPSVKPVFDLLVAQYGIDVYELENNKYLSPKTPVYEFMTPVLDVVFAKQPDTKYDYIIQFNPDYLKTNDVFRILYPLKDDVMYINRQFDIIYTSKNCMHMLYQIIKSTYFEEYISGLQESKRALFKLFHKRHFYDYVQNIFTTKDYC